LRALKAYEIACSVLFAGALCAYGFADVRTQQQRSPSSAPGDVRSIVVTHLPDDIFTRTQVSLERLRRAPEARRVTLVRPADIREALASFASRTPSDRRTYDARWEFVVLRLERLVRDLKARYPALRGARA